MIHFVCSMIQVAFVVVVGCGGGGGGGKTICAKGDKYEGVLKKTELFLAHLSRRLKVRYCDRSSSGVRRASSVNFFL